jgi:hypothetical protein
MKFLKAVLVVLMFCVSLLVSQPASADPIAEKSPEYAEITQALDTLLQSVADPAAAGYTDETLQQKVASLQLQKYIMETSEDWGVCKNATAGTLGVYAHRPSKKGVVENTLFYLGAGQTTDDDWDCDGVYLPSGSRVSLNPTDVEGQTLSEPIAVKIVDGTQLVITTNSNGITEFNLPPAETLTASTATNWSIPDLAQADIDAAKPNAPND